VTSLHPAYNKSKARVTSWYRRIGGETMLPLASATSGGPVDCAVSWASGNYFS